MHKFTTQQIAYRVNEEVINIQKELFDRDGVEVFTDGNCAFMPTFYKQTGVSVLTIGGTRVVPPKDTHYMSVLDKTYVSPKEPHHGDTEFRKGLQGFAYDITCDESREFVNLYDWFELGFPFPDNIEKASWNYKLSHLDPEFNPCLDDREYQAGRAIEKVRMMKTLSELRKRLFVNGMLEMKRDPETGLYLQNV